MTDEARLCRWVQGVRFHLRDGGRVVEALVLRDALQDCFGAGDEPARWLEAYGRNRSTIHRAARVALAQRPLTRMLVLCASDIGACIASADAAG